MNLIISNYFIDIYAIIWCFYLLFHVIKHKSALFMISWSIAQLILFSIDFLDRFLNKGYCLTSNCELTNRLRLYFNINLNQEGSIIIRFISMSLMFIAIFKMHKFIEKNIKK